ncbi:MAG: hypothetical protein LBB42_00770 [Coriobacteriales bacterium]|jgi:hypothetical protein|nr:hypothetical protein [Coriobacteriales bacterium]
MSLFIEEARKILKQRMAFIGVALLLALNIYNILSNETDAIDQADIGYWEIYGIIEGKMTEESIGFVMESLERLSTALAAEGVEPEEASDAFYTGYAFGDYVVFDKHRQEMERIFLYNDRIQKLKISAKENADFYESLGNNYESKKSELIAMVYGNRTLDHYYETAGMQKYFSYDFSSLLIMLSLMLIASSVFAKEHELKTHQLTFVAIKGHHRTVLAKSIAAASVAVVLCFTFYVSDLICFLCSNHLFGWMTPIYQIRGFAPTPLTISVWQFALISFFLKCFGCILISQIIVFFSALLKSTIATVVLSAALLFLCVGLYGLSTFDPINPISFLYNRDFLSAPSFVNVCGVPVKSFQLVILAGFVEVTGVHIATHLAHKKIALKSVIAKWAQKKRTTNEPVF